MDSAAEQADEIIKLNGCDGALPDNYGTNKPWAGEAQGPERLLSQERKTYTTNKGRKGSSSLSRRRKTPNKNPRIPPKTDDIGL